MSALKPHEAVNSDTEQSSLRCDTVSHATLRASQLSTPESCCYTAGCAAEGALMGF